MKTVTVLQRSGAALVAALLMAAGPAPAPVSAPGLAPASAPGPDTAGAPVPLSRQPRTWMDTAARRLSTQDLAEARRAGEAPLLLVGSARLGSAPGDRAALFVQHQCGNCAAPTCAERAA